MSATDRSAGDAGKPTSVPDSPFITRATTIMIESGEGLARPISLVRYERAEIRPAHFDLYGIARPAAVARSVARRQADFLAGRIAAGLALSRLGLVGAAVALGAQREPVWPSEIVGSISHNGRIAGAAAARDGLLGLGIDVEDIVPEDQLAAVLDLAVSASELDLLRRFAPAAPFNWLATLIFSAKESFYKAAFASARQIFEFDAVETMRIDLDRRTLVMAVTRTLSADIREGAIVEAHFRRLDERATLTFIALR